MPFNFNNSVNIEGKMILDRGLDTKTFLNTKEGFFDAFLRASGLLFQHKRADARLLKK